MNEIKIPNTNKTIGSSDVFIIAEIGKNFIQTKEEKSVDEYINNAKVLIDKAVWAGVDAVKFQTHVLEDEQLQLDITSPHFKVSDRVSWIRRNEKATPDRFWDEIKKYCKEKGILFFSTPMSRKAAQKLGDVDLWKIGSGDVQDYVTLNYLLATKKPIIISTGMISLEELDSVVSYIQKKKGQLVILYCVSKYPCSKEDFNLGTIEYFREKYPNISIGFSDHSIGHDVTLSAVSLGATVIEKHFSLSRDLFGADHKVSMTPEEMKKMVTDIRNGKTKKTDQYYGKKDKELEGATNQFRPYFNKSLVAGHDMQKGVEITEEMVYAMRPRKYIDGLHANQLDLVLGKRAKQDLSKYDPIKIDSIE